MVKDSSNAWKLKQSQCYWDLKKQEGEREQCNYKKGFGGVEQPVSRTPDGQLLTL